MNSTKRLSRLRVWLGTLTPLLLMALAACHK